VSKPRRIASDAQTKGSTRNNFADLSIGSQFAETSKRVQHSTRCDSFPVFSPAAPCTCPVVIPSEVEESLDIG
jgi:hypothetical protein